MSTNKNHKAPERSEDEIKAWMEEHPQEYGEFAADMSEADLLAVFLLGQSAFSASPEFRKRLEDMIDLDNLDLEELLKILGNRAIPGLYWMGIRRIVNGRNTGCPLLHG